MEPGIRQWNVSLVSVGAESVIAHHDSVGSHRRACRAGGKSVDEENTPERISEHAFKIL